MKVGQIRKLKIPVLRNILSGHGGVIEVSSTVECNCRVVIDSYGFGLKWQIVKNNKNKHSWHLIDCDQE